MAVPEAPLALARTRNTSSSDSDIRDLVERMQHLIREGIQQLHSCFLFPQYVIEMVLHEHRAMSINLRLAFGWAQDGKPAYAGVLLWRPLKEIIAQIFEDRPKVMRIIFRVAVRLPITPGVPFS